MEIYLLRHAIAVPRGARDYLGSDDHRPLTSEGIASMRQGAKGMARLGLSFDEILSSPLPRAIETARIVADTLKCNERLAECQELRPETPLGNLEILIQSRERDSRVLLVGHEPGLSDLAARVLSGTQRGFLEFKKGGLALIEADTVRGRLEGQLKWLVTPKILRSLGK